MKNEARGQELEKRMEVKPRLRLAWVIPVFGLAGLVLAAVLPQQVQFTLSAEGAGIELLSVFCLLITGLIVCFLRPLRAWAHVSLLAFLLAEREYDTLLLSEGSFLRIAIEWVDKDLLHNRIVIAVLGMWLIFGLLYYTWPLFRDNFRKRRYISMGLCVSILLVLVSQVIELVAKSQGTTLFSASTLNIWEELIELYFALSVLVLAVIGLRHQAASRASCCKQEACQAAE